MKRLLAILFLSLFIGGCGVQMTPKYSLQLDKQVVLMKVKATEARAGKLTQAQMTEDMVRCYALLRLWQDARDGKANGIDPVAYVEKLKAEIPQPTTAPGK